MFPVRRRAFTRIYDLAKADYVEQRLDEHVESPDQLRITPLVAWWRESDEGFSVTVEQALPQGIGSRSSARAVRVAFYGNVANNFYQIAKALRSHAGVDAHLFVERGDAQNAPESDDPELRGKHPEWIHTRSATPIRHKLLPWRSEFVRELSSYDVVVVSGTGAALANFVPRPVLFYATGHDLTVAPFPLDYVAGLDAFESRLDASVGVAKALWFGGLQRRGLWKCRELLVAPYEPFLTALRRLRLPADRISTTYFPLIIDTERFGAPSAPGLASEAVRAIKSRFDFTVFHPSRLMIEANAKMRSAGQWKANDVLIRAFARFVRGRPAARPGLVLLERPSKEVVTADVQAAKSLIAELGIADNVLWLRGPHSFGFTRAELASIYHACDAVADDFGAGWFGSVVLEGLTARRPVLCYVDKRAMEQMYPWHPMLSSNTEEGLASLMSELESDPDRRRASGEAGRRWVEEFHAPATASSVYARHLRSLLPTTT